MNKTPWALYNEVNKNNTRDYSVFRCPDPVAVKTGPPWYPEGGNVCPCDPNLSNVTGRGFTACTFGINQSTPPTWVVPAQVSSGQLPSSQITGSMFQQNQFVPPQLDPRPLTQVGFAWRSAN